MVNENSLTVVGKANFHGESRLFGMKLDDRRRHMHAMGKTGMGKTSFLLNMAVSDINNGHGFAFIDPHGDVTDDLLNYIPEHRIHDVVYFSPADMDYPLAFNVLGDVPKDQRHIVGDGLVGVFQKIWADSWGPRLEYILRNAINTLLQYPETTLLDIMKILVDKEFRKQVVDYIDDPVLKSFWINEFGKYNDKMVTEAISPIQNKVGQFTSSPLIRNIIGQKQSSFDIRKIMDERKILLMNLSKGAVGEGGAQLLGAMMITKMQLAAMSRVDIPQEERKDFFAYVDEFQNFSTDSFAEILSEARKYRLGLILAHQYIEQLSDSVRAAVFGNVGTTAMFRIGAGDAETMEKEYGPDLTSEDLVNLPKYHIYVKLMIDGVTSKPFMANTLPNPPYPPINYRDQIIEYSRKTYGRHIDEVSKVIAESSEVPEITVPGGKKNKKPSKTVVWKNPALEGGSDAKDAKSNTGKKEQVSEKKEERKPEKKIEVKDDKPQREVSQPSIRKEESTQEQVSKSTPKQESSASQNIEEKKMEVGQKQESKQPSVAETTQEQEVEQEFRLDISDSSKSEEKVQEQSQGQDLSPVEKKDETLEEKDTVSVFEEIQIALKEEVDQMPDWQPAPEGEEPNGAVMQVRKDEKKKRNKKKKSKNKKKRDFDGSNQSQGSQLPPDLPPLGASKEEGAQNLMAEKLKQMFAAKTSEDGETLYEVKDDFKKQQEEKARLKQQEREAKQKQRELERQQKKESQSGQKQEAKKEDGVRQDVQKIQKSIESPKETIADGSEKSKMPVLKKPVDDRFDLRSFKKPSSQAEKKEDVQQKSVEQSTPLSPQVSEKPQKSQDTSHTDLKAGEKVSIKKSEKDTQSVIEEKKQPEQDYQQENTKVDSAQPVQEKNSQDVEVTEPLSSIVSGLLTDIQDGYTAKSKQEVLHEAFHDNRPTEKRVLKPGQVIHFKKK